VAEFRRYAASSTEEVERKYAAEREEMALRGLEPATEHRTKEKSFLRTQYVLTVEYGPEKPWTGLRVYPSGSLRYRVESAKEARDVIKELRMHKKQLAVEKKQLTAEASMLRARNRGRTSSGPVADRLAAIGQAKATLDNRAVVLDRGILALEQYLLAPEGTAEGTS
jgi:hypothetical protein